MLEKGDANIYKVFAYQHWLGDVLHLLHKTTEIMVKDEIHRDNLATFKKTTIFLLRKVVHYSFEDV